MVYTSYQPTDPTCSYIEAQLGGPRCSFNAQISHGVKYPQLPHKIHNLRLIWWGGRGGGESYNWVQLGTTKVGGSKP